MTNSGQTNSFTPRRSALYVPSGNENALNKSVQLPADALIFDLEDAVAPENKDRARDMLKAALEGERHTEAERIVRVNGLADSHFRADLEILAASKADGVLFPKVSSAGDVKAIADALRLCHREDASVWLMVETPGAIVNLSSILTAAEQEGVNVICLVLGLNDLAKATRVPLSKDRQAFVPWIMHALAVARMHSVDLLDGVFNAIRDEDGLRDECIEARRFGLDGKSLIHPSHIEVANDVFKLTDEEVAAAKAIVAAFAEPENRDADVLVIDGVMTERLHLAMAQRVLQIYTRLAERNPPSNNAVRPPFG